MGWCEFFCLYWDNKNLKIGKCTELQGDLEVSVKTVVRQVKKFLGTIYYKVTNSWQDGEQASFSAGSCRHSAGKKWTLYPKCGAHVKTDDTPHTPRDMKRFITHITMLSGKLFLLGWSRMACKSEEETDVGFHSSWGWELLQVGRGFEVWASC